MKKVLLLCFAFVNIYWLNAQTDIDALRYSTTQNWGTARNIGTGGIFSSQANGNAAWRNADRPPDHDFY